MSSLVVVPTFKHGDARAIGACLAVVAADRLGGSRGRGVVLLDLHAGQPPRRTLLATDAARSLEPAVREAAAGQAAARGHVCAVLGEGESVGATVEAGILADPDWLVVPCPPGAMGDAIAAGADHGWPTAVVSVTEGLPRGLPGLMAHELREAGVPLKLWRRSPGWVATRRSLAGIDPGGHAGDTAERQLRSLFGLGSGR